MKTEKGFMPAVRAALYCRVSTEEQAVRGLSIDAQREALDAWAAEHKVRVARHYVDAGISARKPASKRPELQRLLEDVRAGKIDLIVFTKLDRWFRNVAEYHRVQAVLEQHHVAWQAIQEDYETSTSSGRFKVNIMLSVAETEADRTSERIKAVFDTKRERKEPCTGSLPTGYKMDHKKIIKDPELEEAVSCFFENFFAYRSLEKARQTVIEKCGVSFPYFLVDRMLRNPAYYGNFGGMEGMCPAYITKAQHDEARANRRVTARKNAENRVHLFSGLIFCGACGRRYGSRARTYTVQSGERRDCICYNCRGRYNSNDCSNSVNIVENKIEKYLLTNVDAELKRFVYQIESDTAAAKPRKNFSEERAKIKKRLSRLKDLYVDAIIDLELYRKDYEILTAELDALTTEESLAPAEPPSSDRLLSIFESGWQEVYAEMDRSHKQDFWRMTIERICIYPTRQITVTFRP